MATGLLIKTENGIIGNEFPGIIPSTATYYVDPQGDVGGNDNNTGLSIAQSWATGAPVANLISSLKHYMVIFRFPQNSATYTGTPFDLVLPMNITGKRLLRFEMQQTNTAGGSSYMQGFSIDGSQSSQCYIDCSIEDQLRCRDYFRLDFGGNRNLCSWNTMMGNTNSRSGVIAVSAGDITISNINTFSVLSLTASGTITFSNVNNVCIWLTTSCSNLVLDHVGWARFIGNVSATTRSVTNCGPIVGSGF